MMPSALSLHQGTPSSPHRQDALAPLYSVSVSPPLPSSTVLFLGIPEPNNSLSSPRRSLLMTGDASHALLAGSEGLCLC